MVDSMYCLTILLFFDIQLYYYINLRSSIISLPFFWSFISFFRCFFIMVNISCSFITVSKIFCGKVLETSVFLLATLLPIRSVVASSVVWIAFLEAVLSAYVGDCLAWPRRFWLYSLLTFFYVTLELITRVMFILSFISSDLEFWSVNHTSIWKLRLNVF